MGKQLHGEWEGHLLDELECNQMIDRKTTGL